MPNWCSTDITINCNNKKEAISLYNKINEWTSTNYHENGFGLDWLGNIVGNSGIDQMNDEDFSIRCRGRLTYLELYEDDNAVFVATETAWSPMLQMWRMICNKYLTEYELIYTAEECGCGVYFTNDPVLFGKYLIDSANDDFSNKYLSGETYDREASEAYLKTALQKCLNTSENDINVLLDMFNESDYEDVYIYPWEEVPIDELD